MKHEDQIETTGNVEVKARYINGKRVHAFPSKRIFLDYISPRKTILIALAAEKLSNKTPELDEIINRHIGYPDGIGAVWALRRKGLHSVKIPGVEFWLDILDKFYRQKSVYLIGSTQETIEKTVHRLRKDYEGIRILGYRDGFLKDGDRHRLIQDITSKKPDLVFVAMGSPKQEFLMNELFGHHPALYMGLGGSFDIYSGNKKRAPKFYLMFGLEWLYRLIKEPKRIFRQLNLVKFAIRIIFGRL